MGRVRLLGPFVACQVPGLAVVRKEKDGQLGHTVADKTGRVRRAGRATLWSLWVIFAVLVPACSVPVRPVSTVPPMIFTPDMNAISVRSSDGRVSRVTDGQGAVWAPDHRMLIVQRDLGVGSTSDLWLVALDGKTVRKLTATYPDQVRFFAAGRNDHRSFVVYDTDRPGIQAVNLDGSGKRNISIPGPVDWLSVSSDGSQIAFVIGYGEGRRIPSGLYVISSDGHGKPRLVIADGLYREASCPAFSPNGQWIALTMTIFKGGSNEVGGVWLVHPNGAGLHLLATGSNPTWSPDGSWIAYANESQSVLLKVHPDGTDRSQLMRFGARYSSICLGDQPTW